MELPSKKPSPVARRVIAVVFVLAGLVALSPSVIFVDQQSWVLVAISFVVLFANLGFSWDLTHTDRPLTFAVLMLFLNAGWCALAGLFAFPASSEAVEHPEWWLQIGTVLRGFFYLLFVAAGALALLFDLDPEDPVDPAGEGGPDR